MEVSGDQQLFSNPHSSKYITYFHLITI